MIRLFSKINSGLGALSQASGGHARFIFHCVGLGSRHNAVSAAPTQHSDSGPSVGTIPIGELPGRIAADVYKFFAGVWAARRTSGIVGAADRLHMSASG